MLNDLYFKEFPKFESQRLDLRQLSLSDASEVQIIRSNERVMIDMDQERHQSLQQSEESIFKKIEKFKDLERVQVNKKGTAQLHVDFDTFACK